MIEIGRSLRSRLAGWLVVGAALVGTLLLVDAAWNARADANRAYDAQLQAAALSIADDIRWRDGQPVVSVPAAALRILAGDHEERVFYAVFDGHGHRLAGNLALPIAPALRAQASRHPTYRTAVFQRVDWRLHGRRFDLAGWSSSESLQIWVGQTDNGRRALAHDLFMPAAIRFLIFLAAAALFGGLAIRSALAPLKRLREQLRGRHADDDQPLSSRVPGELSELVHTLDHLLARQRASRAGLLRFIADASHQLKTPLAGLQTASEVALLHTEPAAWRVALKDIHESAARSSRLAGQLLNLARLQHGTLQAAETLDLSVLAADYTRRAADTPAASHHDLGFAPPDTALECVHAEAWALRELIGNLIDNALAYTPAGSQITVGVTAHAKQQGMVVLYVEDDGPGVDSAALARLTEPFERAGRTDAQGSGLGLAIVDSAARQHGGTLRVINRSSGGLRIAVELPTTDHKRGLS